MRGGTAGLDVSAKRKTLRSRQSNHGHPARSLVTAQLPLFPSRQSFLRNPKIQCRSQRKRKECRQLERILTDSTSARNFIRYSSKVHYDISLSFTPWSRSGPFHWDLQTAFNALHISLALAGCSFTFWIITVLTPAEAYNFRSTSLCNCNILQPLTSSSILVFKYLVLQVPSATDKQIQKYTNIQIYTQIARVSLTKSYRKQRYGVSNDDRGEWKKAVWPILRALLAHTLQVTTVLQEQREVGIRAESELGN